MSCSLFLRQIYSSSDRMTFSKPKVSNVGTTYVPDGNESDFRATYSSCIVIHPVVNLPPQAFGKQIAERHCYMILAV